MRILNAINNERPCKAGYIPTYCSIVGQSAKCCNVHHQSEMHLSNHPPIPDSGGLTGYDDYEGIFEYFYYHYDDAQHLQHLWESENGGGGAGTFISVGTASQPSRGGLMLDVTVARRRSCRRKKTTSQHGGECAVIAPRRQLTISIFYCHQKRKSLDVRPLEGKYVNLVFQYTSTSPSPADNNNNNIQRRDETR